MECPPVVDEILFDVYNPGTRLQVCPLFHHGYLLRTARNLAAAVRAVHERGHVIGDLNESNILVNSMALVTLVDTDGAGVERITERGVVVGGMLYEVDCIVYATGFEGELTPFARRAGHDIIGRDGVTMEQKWKDGVLSLHGMSTHGFPNMFIMPAPGQQAVTTHNFTHLMVVGADHVAETIGALDAQGVKVFETTEEAEQAWTDIILSTWRDNSAFMAACTPSRLNFEGNPAMLNPRSGAYGGGYGDFFGYQDLLLQWRARGDFEGFELTCDGDAS